MRAQFYYRGASIQVAMAIMDYLNSIALPITREVIGSTRGIGDLVESVLAGRLEDLLGDWCSEYSADFARRAMADMAFTDKQGIHSVIDVKTHREGTQFNRPNLTSVRRLARLYESNTNVYAIILIRYNVPDDTTIKVTDVEFVPIEFLEWSCLTLGALGWGQIEIADSNDIRVNSGYSRKEWMLELCEAVLGFYPREIEKINDRIEHFENLRQTWESAEDVWGS